MRDRGLLGINMAICGGAPALGGGARIPTHMHFMAANTRTILDILKDGVLLHGSSWHHACMFFPTINPLLSVH